MTTTQYLFDDNPSTRDLTGLDSAAAAISSVLLDQRFDTVTVGLNSPWGGGKSTALNLIAARLRAEPGVIVVVVDPWEFVDSGDPRGTLISRVLEGIAAEIARSPGVAGEQSLSDKLKASGVDILGKLDEMRKRVSWSKVAQVAVKSAVTLTPDFAGLVDALTPGPAAAPEKKGLRDFREDFALLLGQLEDQRVVVLIDDLDRSLPDDVLGALEAIKLFLSVKGMAFVIAADDDFIRESLRDALDLHGGSRGRFADRYTEKIVQLPFSLPRLSSADAVAYLVALFVQAEAGHDQATKVAERASERRAQGQVPYVAPNMADRLPTSTQIALANQIVRGMSTSRRETPRQLKRFLNNFSVRAAMLGAQFDGFPIEVLMKLWLLEQNHPKYFRDLVGTEPAGRLQLLKGWGQTGDDVPAELSGWANEDEKAASIIVWVDRYVSFAAATVTTLQSAMPLDQGQGQQLRDLIDSSIGVRKEALDRMVETPSPGDEDVARHLATAIVGDQSEYALQSLSDLAERRTDLVPAMRETMIDEFILGGIAAEHLPWISRAFPEVLDALEALPTVDETLRQAIVEERDGTSI